MQDNIIKNSKKVHFIGIGGIGISSVARMLLLDGVKVSGSDRGSSMITDELSKFGADIKIGHSSENVPQDTDLLIYTIAIPNDNPELNEAKNRNIRCLTYPQALHEISKDKYTIAVSGTHGKTTTTAMIAKIMMDAGLDPTVIVGSFLKENKSNFISGQSKYLVVEACEYKKSFLNIEPDIAVITNIDNDHLDFYKDINAIKDAFGEFAAKIPKDGWLVIDKKNNIVSSAVENAIAGIVDSGTSGSNIKLKFPGKHNKDDAKMAIAVAGILGISEKAAEKSLENFGGTWRRFESRGETKNGAIVYDDYAHHPTEIKATLGGTREMFSDKKIIAVFQPHLYSRTKLLMNDFEESFNDADLLLLAPIYAAREKEDESVSSEILSRNIKNTKALSFSNFEDIEKYLYENLKKGDILITMGAGDIYKIGDIILEAKQDFFLNV